MRLPEDVWRGVAAGRGAESAERGIRRSPSSLPQPRRQLSPARSALWSNRPPDPSQLLPIAVFEPCAFSEYGAPEEGELAKRQPFALKNQLLSKPRLFPRPAYRPNARSENCFFFFFSPRLRPQRSRLCLRTTRRRRRWKRNFQVSAQQSGGGAPPRRSREFVAIDCSNVPMFVRSLHGGPEGQRSSVSTAEGPRD